MSDKFLIAEKKIRTGWFKKELFYYIYSGIIPFANVYNPAFVDVTRIIPGLGLFNYHDQAKEFGAKEIRLGRNNGYDLFFDKLKDAEKMVEWLEGVYIANTLADVKEIPPYTPTTRNVVL